MLTLALAALVSQTQAQKLRDGGQVAGTGQDDMRQAVEYLASQELGGRYPGTAGDTLASAFITSKLRGLKLKPVLKAKKEKGFYHDFSYGKAEQRTTHNILAVLPGNDKRLRNEYIVVGSHYDHLGMGGQGSGSRRPDTLGVHPGADDNASGDAVVLELAKHFKKVGSPRSIIFAFFGAEEQGLVGSKKFIEWMKQEDGQRRNLPKDIKGVVAMVNLDMVGRMRGNALSVSGTGTSSGFKALAEEGRSAAPARELCSRRLWPERPGIVCGSRHSCTIPDDWRPYGVSHPCRRAIDVELRWYAADPRLHQRVGCAGGRYACGSRLYQCAGQQYHEACQVQGNLRIDARCDGSKHHSWSSRRHRGGGEACP